MGSIGRAIYTAPSVANPNGVGISIGDYFVDLSGAEPGFAMVMGPNGGRTLFRVASQSIGPDVVSVVSSSTGAGNRTLTFTVRDALGVVRPAAVVGLALVGSNVQTVTQTTGAAMVQATALDAWVWGVTDGAGVLAVSVDGVAAATLDYIISNVSANPGKLVGSVVIP